MKNITPEQQALVVQAPPTEQAVVAATSTMGVAGMLEAIIKQGISKENVSALESLVKLYERMQDRDAEQQFAAAFVKLQSEMPKVEATRPVPNNDGSVRYRFAPFEEIMAQVAPTLQANGFTVSFSCRFQEGRIIQTCTLQHKAGHSRTNEFAVRIGSGPPKSTESQADGAAATYAKRFALCDALNIVIAHIDNDAAAEGGLITPEQAKSLRERVKATASDETAFLRFAGARTYEEIRAEKYAVLDSSLRKKEKTV